MTRYTNVALKRSYVEAGFNNTDPEEDSREAGPSNSVDKKVDANDNAAPATKKRNRNRNRSKSKKSSDVNGETAMREGSSRQDGLTEDHAGGEDTVQNHRGEKGKVAGTKAAKGKNKLKQKGSKGYDARKAASEQRRLRRQDDILAETICYACREKGHAARNCPKAIASDALASEVGRPKLGKQVVGICYRCGSRKHNLARCPKPVDPENPLPFSSCFVCSKQGHLASSCPENRSKGVYPNGGCCKLCGETAHLAKDCPMRKTEVVSISNFVGTGAGAGADEDDFHTFKRKNLEVTKEEKADERRKKQQAVRVGAHSGVMKAFGRTTQSSRKVVKF
ncbi:hypothetical protein BC835DRAFT_1408157 [Cytidiella melzeri]|nr:hypothetical protein BC835DRAFT_1408157 [Cytidiella melzeri]